jgi:protein-L-isoaspartate O-methyltransferase
MAAMLEQLEVQAGHNVMEIGAGTGYYAALLATLTGEGGQVFTIDIDDDIVTDAKMCHLAAMGALAQQNIVPDLLAFTSNQATLGLLE